MKNLKYHENYQNMTQKSKVNKLTLDKWQQQSSLMWSYYKSQFVKNVVTAKCNKVK